MSVTITSTTPAPLTGQGTVDALGTTVTCSIAGPVNNSRAATMNGTDWAVNFGNVPVGCYAFSAVASDNTEDDTTISVGGIPC